VTIDVRAAAARLAAAGIDGALREARILEREANGDAAVFERWIERRATREPVCYIIGVREFWSMDFEVSPAVLIPRPDSETLVEEALRVLKASPPRRLIDLGTGSGCLIISLLKEWPESRGVAVDISPEALAVARRNAERHGVADRIEFIHGDLAGPFEGRFDLVISNPPYIADAVIDSLDLDVRGFEPHLALKGGPEGLDVVRRLGAALHAMLAPGAPAIIEIGYDQGESAAQALQNQGLLVTRIVKDLGANDRVVVVELPQ
jgi:release factor glutamine methyltransferase